METLCLAHASFAEDFISNDGRFHSEKCIGLQNQSPFHNQRLTFNQIGMDQFRLALLSKGGGLKALDL